MIAAPDYCEPLIGWRAWHAVARRGDIYLVSLFHRVRWPWLEALGGTCLAWHAPWRRHARHPPPGTECKCGIYAGSLETAGRYLSPSPRLEWPGGTAWPVIGNVALWGDVIEYTEGWRASFAYPKQLFVPVGRRRRRLAARVAVQLERYGVPVEPIEASTTDDVVAALASRQERR